MRLTVVGTGYVGLVTGACFAEMGLTVTCVDIDEAKVAALRRGEIPIHEPGLEPLVKSNVAEGRLSFSTSLAEAMQNSSIHFIAVGTPPDDDGSADLSHVLAVARDIGRNLERYAVIVDKSTVPVGTADRVRQTIQAELDARGVDIEFDVVSNPEFLKEGAAVEDFMKPDRIIIGTDSERAAEKMRQLYAPFNRNHQRTLFMGVRDAEMTKYAANAMLATKISFINEIAVLCDRLGVDVENVRRGIGSDQRIGYHFIYPGCGYGGSCFPKDVKALVRTAHESGVEPTLLQAVEARNQAQRRLLFDKIVERFGADLSGLHFAVWGLAFKPGTDDMREASSRVLIEALTSAGASVCAYDPVAMWVARREFAEDLFADGRLQLAENQYDALDGADAMVLVTEWKPFRFPDFGQMKRRMRRPVIFDGRNQYDPRMVKEEGFEYAGIGRR
ncbi:UDP-glucose dehydrogenase [Geothermobacter ehrlichii]|uniref:UDP-glucose 6-dehydrogenase n=1 Tax=Geothermobacter ehrlichii TaxID=213224 RepID=A0A5D3WIP6_9BACT|nr:UDP-glucose/GDP-mannose dehydrogenase family protein [Geothermobacter ehrlichii]TYO96119.1 UDP-glucose dehydrogenase [Geothermobacter ehrlichii]